MDLHLTVVQPFSHDVRALNAALDRVLTTPPVVSGPSGGGVAETAGPPGRYLSTESAQDAEIRRRLQSGFEGQQHAAAQATSLSALVRLLARFPGRKAVVLFSEGLNVSPRLESVVDSASGENVTIYTINATGLEPGGSHAFTGRDVDRRELTGTSAVDRPREHRFHEMDQTYGLGPLALHTGGFLMADTNDIGGALAAVNADRRSFYLLAYMSSKSALDGSVRHIEVRVKRPQVSVRARSAYVAAKRDAR